MKYPVFILKDKDSDYGVTVPDLPGCYSAGGTVDEALNNAQEAIACHCEGLLMDGELIPLPGPIEQHKKKYKNKNAVWALVDFNIVASSGKAKRINLTIPEKILRQMDYHARKRGESRSGFVASAALEYIHSSKKK